VTSESAETGTPALISAQRLMMQFLPGQPVLHDVSFNSAAGEFVAVLGPSGCGKSTLLRLVAGLLTPTGGRLLVAGQLPQEARRTGTRVAFVFQDPTLLPWRTVTENLRLPFELQGVSRAHSEASIVAVLDLVGLKAADRRKRPRQLSGGMRMRVSLARALVTDPNVLLLDEPFAALDDVLRQQLNEELVRIWQQSGWTALFVTHNVAEAVFLSQRVLVMTSRPGSILAEVDVPFPYPRTAELRGTVEFARLTATLSQRLREATQS
jgi:NitT/TauT family transport system ATP-binding protein